MDRLFPPYLRKDLAKWDFTLGLPLQGVTARRPGVSRLPQHEGGVVVHLGNFGGPRALGDVLGREIEKKQRFQQKAMRCNSASKTLLLAGSPGQKKV